MKLLALDTATEVCAVAVVSDGDVLERQVMGRQHAERILETIEQLLSEAQLPVVALDAIAFGRGPGMFTGLRIGAGVVQGIAFAADLPVVPVSSLQVLAQGQVGDRILAAFDARMGQVYWGCYARNNEGMVEPCVDERVDAPTDVDPPEGVWLGAGSGWDVYASELIAILDDRISGWNDNRFPTAGDLARLGQHAVSAGKAVAAELAIPVYVRDDVARKSRE